MPTVEARAAEIRRSLRSAGYYYDVLSSQDGSEATLVALARCLGEIHVPPDVDPQAPIIETRPAAGEGAPFDRREAIGWHGDFSTHADRPGITLALVTRADPRGAMHGAWRVAPVDELIGALDATEMGAEVMQSLLEQELPFSYALDEPPSYFHVLARRPDGRLGLRFYGSALRNGCRLAFGMVPPHVSKAISAVERAADEIGCVHPAPAGALLVVDNWHCLHDRSPQTVEGNDPRRRALLCFVRAVRVLSE